MGRVQSAGREVNEERLIRRHRMLETHPCDRVIGHIGHEVVARSPCVFDMCDSVEDHRRPLVSLSAEKAVKIFETVAYRPTCEGSGYAGLPNRRLMHLAEGCGAVAIQLEDLGDRGYLVRPHTGVSRSAGCQFCNRSHPDRMMVASCKKRLARRRAERGGMELRVAQAVLRE